MSVEVLTGRSRPLWYESASVESFAHKRCLRAPELCYCAIVLLWHVKMLTDEK